MSFDVRTLLLTFSLARYAVSCQSLRRVEKDTEESIF